MSDAKSVRRAAVKCRLDMIREVLSVDEEKRIAHVRMLPDPRRYSRIERDERGTWYLDQYLNEAFRLEDFADSLEGLPVYGSNRTIESATDYATERRAALASEIATGNHIPPRQGAKPHTTLAATEDERDIAFISLDICNSTQYQQRDPGGFKAAFEMLLRELGSTVGQFQGSILKATGDGFIAYLDFPGFTVLADSTIDLCGTMLEVLHSALNPAILDAGFEPLSIRIGADYGPAMVRELSVPLTGFSSPEVSSDALNRAVKIEQSCDPNTARVGFDLYRILHVQWLERCKEVEFDGSEVGIPEYRVFELH